MLKFIKNRQILFDKVVFRTYRCKDTYQLVVYNLKTHTIGFLDDCSAELFEIMYKGNEQEINKFLIKNGLLDEFSEFINELIQENILNGESQLREIVSINNIDNENITEFYDELYKNGYLFNLHLDVTKKCNLRCKHCYHPFEEYSYENELDLEAIKRIVDNAYDKGVFVIILSGGDPLIRKDIKDIMEYITKKGMCIDLFTNATLMNTSFIDRMKDYNINRVSISVYSTNDEVHDEITQVKGSLNKTLFAVDELIAAGFQVELKSVMMKENFADYKLLREYANRKQIKLVLDTSMTPKLNSDSSPIDLALTYEQYLQLCLDEESDYYIDKVKGMNPNEPSCNAGRYSLYCDSDGEIYPCVSFRLHLGNVKEGLGKAQNNSTLRSWIEMKNCEYEGYNKHSYCKFCTEICAGISQLENGDYKKCEKSDCYKAKAREQAYKEVNSHEKARN